MKGNTYWRYTHFPRKTMIEGGRSQSKPLLEHMFLGTKQRRYSTKRFSAWRYGHHEIDLYQRHGINFQHWTYMLNNLNPLRKHNQHVLYVLTISVFGEFSWYQNWVSWYQKKAAWISEADLGMRCRACQCWITVGSRNIVTSRKLQ